MGYSISWVAVKDKAPELWLQELKLSPTGVMADYGREPFTGRTLPSGWFILVFNRCEHKFLNPNSLASLSSNCDLVASSAEEQALAGGKAADVDYFFDIPLQTAKSIVGFKHDDDDGLEDNSFEVFKTQTFSSLTKPWWKVW